MKIFFSYLICRFVTYYSFIFLAVMSSFFISTINATGNNADVLKEPLEVQRLSNALITIKQPIQINTRSFSLAQDRPAITITVIVTIIPGLILPGIVQTPIPLAPTNTPFPTETPNPTNTPFPTETPSPTDTPFPTKTPSPTPGPIERFTSDPSVRVGGSMGLILLIFFGLLSALGVPFLDNFLQFFRQLFRTNPTNTSIYPTVITGAKLGEEFDQDIWIERSEFISLKNYIRQIDSGNIAIAGPRGIGKSTLMQALLQDKEYSHFVTLGISTPTRYEEKDFVLNLFEGLCWAVLKRIRNESTLRSLKLSENMYQGPQYTWRERLRPIGFIVSISILYILGQQINAIASYFDRFNYYGATVIGWVFFLTSIFLMGFVIFVLLWVISPIFQRSIIEKIRRIDPTLAELYVESFRRLERIGYQQTFQSSGGAEFSLASIIKIGSTIGSSMTRQPYTLVGLIADYREFLRSAVSRFDKVIVCIDELDKVMDPEQAREFLRKIKGVFSLRNTYYLVSVSEEALEAFNLRNLIGKDEVDSTFTTVILLKPLDSFNCKTLLGKRISQTKELETLFSVLSGGIPRDLIRLARRLHFSDNPELSEPKQVIYETISVSVSDVIGSIRQDNEISEKIKLLVTENLGSILQLKEFTNTVEILQATINILSNQTGDKLDWILDVLLRLGIRLEVLVFLANNIAILEDENKSNKYQQIFSLIPNSPLEAQTIFLRLVQLENNVAAIHENVTTEYTLEPTEE